MNSEKLSSNVLSRWSNPNNEPEFSRFCRSMLGSVVEGVGDCCTVVMVAMVEGVRVGADTGRGATVALVEAYESDNIVLDTYGDTITLKRRRDDDADKDEEPSPGSDRGSKRLREGKEPESASTPKEKATRSTGKSTQGSKSQQTSTSESETAEEPMQTTHEMEEPSHLEFETEEVYKATTDQLDWVNPEGQQYPHNLLKPLPLITNSRGRRVIPFDHFINNDLEYICGGVESYQKKLNLTRPDTYRFDLKRKEAYIAYSNPRGFIYQNKDKQNRLMRINELHKFSDGTLTDVRTALDDHLKRIRMKYLPQSIWRKSDKERAATMVQAIDKQLKTRRIMRCLERFVGERL
nr:hypothetical protein [Tanacetum cinerariifolium]